MMLHKNKNYYQGKSMLRSWASICGLVALVLCGPAGGGPSSPPHVEGQLLVRFAPGTSELARTQALAAASVVRSSPAGLVDGLVLAKTRVAVPLAAAALTANPNVLYAEPDYIVQALSLPNDAYFSVQWGHHNVGQAILGTTGTPDADIDAPEAWQAPSTTEIVVAVIDSGIKLDHEDLTARVWVNQAEFDGATGIDDNLPANGFIDDINGWDFFADDADPTDEDGHGTHIAGTIAATRNNLVGIAGICNQCRIMPLRFLGPEGGATSAAIAALNYAVLNGATVSNNSWGGAAYSQALYDAIAAAGEAGHVFVAAAGNNGQNIDASAVYPASYDLPNLISVAATDNNDTLVSYSNFGPGSVDLAAPGVDIISTTWDLETGVDDYAYWSGTSMAAPHVTAVVALVQAVMANEAPEACVDPQSLQPLALVERVLRAARPSTALAAYVGTGGIVNAADAVSCTLNLPWPLPEPPPLPGPPAAPPDDLTANATGQPSYLLSWSGVADASYYLIEWSKQRKNGRRVDGGWFQVNVTPGPGDSTETFEHLIDAADYLFYRIAAGNAQGNTVMSAWVQATNGSTSEPNPDDGDGGSDGGSGRCHPKKGCP